MVHLSTSSKVTTNLFFFLFGFPEGMAPKEEEEEKQEVEYQHINQEEHKHENIDKMFNFMDNDHLLVHDGDHKEKEYFNLEEEFTIPKDIHPDSPNMNSNTPMIRIGNQVVTGPAQSKQPKQERRGRERNKRSSKNKKGARSVSVLAVKDAKMELDLLSSILDSVEKGEKQIQEDFNKIEEADYK